MYLRFTLYKLPRKVNRLFDFQDYPNNKVPFVNQGTAYVYMTNKEPDWKLSNLSLNHTLSFPGLTLNSLYTTNFTDSPKIGYVLYNDQADKVTVIKGHTKGVVLFNEKSVVWIVHSIPHYPPKPSDQSYFIRPPQCVFGQSMLCMSFDFNQLDLIGKQLLYTFPQIFDYYIPENLKSSPVLANLLKVINGEHVQQAPWSNLAYLTTLNGEKMLSIAKFTDFQEDLYSGLVAPTLKSNLLTETWNNGAGTLRSNCTSANSYHVLNIQSIQIESANMKFSVHNDHSKWTVTDLNDLNYYYSQEFYENDEKIKVACVGDINRQIDQFKRAGGTVCFINNQNVWQSYYNLVTDVEECQRVRIDQIKFKKFQSNQTKEKLILL